MKETLAVGFIILFGFGCGCVEKPKPKEDANYTLVEVYSNGLLVKKFRACGCPQVEHNFIAADMNYEVNFCEWRYDCQWTEKRSKWMRIYNNSYGRGFKIPTTYTVICR